MFASISFTSFKKMQLYHLVLLLPVILLSIILLLVILLPVIHPVIWCFPIWLTRSLSYLSRCQPMVRISLDFFKKVPYMKGKQQKGKYWNGSTEREVLLKRNCTDKGLSTMVYHSLLDNTPLGMFFKKEWHYSHVALWNESEPMWTFYYLLRRDVITSSPIISS